MVDWRRAIETLAAIERPSASTGERQAAELIADWLRARGCQCVVEEERAHGGYWWPISLANLLAATFGALSRRRRRAPLLAAAGAGVCAAALWDDLGHGRRWFRRALLPQRSTYNVVGQTGDLSADRVLVVIAHHDAAHSGIVFHPALGRIGPRLTPRLHERSSHTVPILYGTWLGPVLVCLGALTRRTWALRLGLLFCFGASAVMADIGARGVVAGANDNLAAVGVLIALADALKRQPVSGLRVVLLSTGSEESFSEGMQAFGERHFKDLDPQRTEFLCLECLGGKRLCVLEGEGMLKMRDYPESMRQALADAASATGVRLGRGLRTVAATDAIIALRAGYPTATLASVTDAKLPLNYHWPTDVPEAMHWETIEQAIAVCGAFLRGRANRATLAGPED